MKTQWVGINLDCLSVPTHFVCSAMITEAAGWVTREDLKAGDKRRAQLQVTDIPYLHCMADLLLPPAGLTASRRGAGFGLEEEGSFISFREPKEQVQSSGVLSTVGKYETVTSVQIYQSLTLSIVVI